MIKNPKIRSITLVFSFIGVSSCASVANMTGSDTNSLNLQAEQQYSQLVSEAAQKKALVTSGPVYDQVRRVLSRLEPVADQANTTGVPFKWQLALLQSKEINAWVMPGGRVGVYTGLIQTLNLTDAEVAAVLGHEMIHALEEHSKEKAGQQTLSSLATFAMSAYAGSNAGAALGAVSQMGIGLPFSRRLETRADLGGIMIMARAGYDPRAALSLWKKMAALKGQSNAGGLAKYLSDHPDDAERQEAISAALPQAIAIYNQTKTPA